MNNDTTITAIATPAGMGAIAVVRLSGPNSMDICERVFRPSKKGKKLAEQPAYTIHHGKIVDDNKIIDDVLVSIFKAPHSYTGEDVVEISCHGSVLIQRQVLELLIKHGATHAQAGEFTLRAFLNGKMDLSQAEGVADLIASTSETARKVAMDQMRGGFSNQLKELRTLLLNFTSLIELELDFSEEDVEFADRKQLLSLVETMAQQTEKLLESFKLGNVIKTGVPVAIAGKPNVGKSTLLNRILNEEKAIVSDIAGTTRDSIEDIIVIDGVTFRFIDTAGLRHTTDTIESIGIERAYAKISQAQIVLMLIDVRSAIEETLEEISSIRKSLKDDQKLIILANKADLLDANSIDTYLDNLQKEFAEISVVPLSAKHGQNIESLLHVLVKDYQIPLGNDEAVIVTNARHYESLLKALENLQRVKQGINTNIPTDLLAMDIRQVLHYIGQITGAVSTDEILGNIFSKFCIGK
jgi:tRNA modification GTPase